MRLNNHTLSFIRFVDNKGDVNPQVRARVLGTQRKARTDPDMVRRAVSLVQYLSNPAEYQRAGKHEQATGMHFLDVMNLPDNEYPICREIGMGIRELYTDMHERQHADFKGLKVHYSRLPRDKGFKLAVEPDDVRKRREAEEKRALADKGVIAGGGQCRYFSQSFPSTVKKMQHEVSCPKKGHV